MNAKAYGIVFVLLVASLFLDLTGLPSDAMTCVVGAFVVLGVRA